MKNKKENKNGKIALLYFFSILICIYISYQIVNFFSRDNDKVIREETAIQNNDSIVNKDDFPFALFLLF